ncbi:MAG: Uma2 family endonuclease [Bryobacteraceae bacterium]
MGAAPVLKLSVEEYLAADRASELKSEFHEGHMFPVAAASWEHTRIGMEFARLLGNELHGGPCKIAGDTLRVRVSAAQFVYPDLMVVCGKPAFTDEYVDTITNPMVIIEILSPSTSDYDSGGKFRLYRQLDSFKEYVLVAQDQPRIEVFRKNPNGRWELTTYEGFSARVELESLGLSIPLAGIYEI